MSLSPLRSGQHNHAWVVVNRESPIVEEIAVVSQQYSILSPRVRKDVFIRMPVQTDLICEYRVPLVPPEDVATSTPRLSSTRKRVFLRRGPQSAGGSGIGFQVTRQ